MFSRNARLSRGDIERIVKHGKRTNTQCFTLRVLRRGDSAPSRVAVSVSKKVAKSAAVRNMIKRRVRAAISANYDAFSTGFNIFVVVRAQCKTVDFEQLAAELGQGISDTIALC